MVHTDGGTTAKFDEAAAEERHGERCDAWHNLPYHHDLLRICRDEFRSHRGVVLLCYLIVLQMLWLGMRSLIDGVLVVLMSLTL